MEHNFFFFLLLKLFISQTLFGQVFSYKTQENGQDTHHRILMDEEYYVETQFTTKPNQFVKTIGGFYKKDGNLIRVDLEFNSNFSKDSLKHILIERQEGWEKISKKTLPLEGKWLMAGRINGEKERRRDTNRPRKTMKILLGGYFQWIAYDTERFSFYGAGGGTYGATAETYTEIIDYFSRDNNKVGISLVFEYEKKGADWYHKGFSSRGDPLHEIWTFRTP